ncbi:hypothetical protein K439DRAFT_1624695 [Ramaria rubella]|nr:hypothetical protein K439DRAFT_1624695 [Ramaria rubella]
MQRLSREERIHLSKRVELRVAIQYVRVDELVKDEEREEHEEDALEGERPGLVGDLAGELWVRLVSVRWEAWAEGDIQHATALHMIASTETALERSPSSTNVRLFASSAQSRRHIPITSARSSSSPDLRWFDRCQPFRDELLCIVGVLFVDDDQHATPHLPLSATQWCAEKIAGSSLSKAQPWGLHRRTECRVGWGVRVWVDEVAAVCILASGCVVNVGARCAELDEGIPVVGMWAWSKSLRVSARLGL